MKGKGVTKFRLWSKSPMLPPGGLAEVFEERSRGVSQILVERPSDDCFQLNQVCSRIYLASWKVYK